MDNETTKTISVIGNSFLQPITDLLQKLLDKIKSGVNEVQTSSLENGYSASVVLLLVAYLESIMMRERYFQPDFNDNSNINFLEKLVPSYKRIPELKECYIIRDCIIHNHIWEIEHKWSDFTIINSTKEKFSGNKKYNINVDIENRVTRLLKLNVNPIRINRNDVKLVLISIWESINELSKMSNMNIIIPPYPLYFRNKIHSFDDVYNIFIESV